MTATRTHPFAGGRKMKPTQAHRIAVWECMLGTVSAMNDAGQVRYFDYDWDAARLFAGLDADTDVSRARDPRIARLPKTVYRVRYSNDSSKDPRPGQLVLWVKKVA